MAGVFCYQGVQTLNMHCSGDTDSVWCSDFLYHGTILSGAILTTIFSILSTLVSSIFIKSVFGLLRKIKSVIFQTVRVIGEIPILSPIQLAISDGIIHPRIP